MITLNGRIETELKSTCDVCGHSFYAIYHSTKEGIERQKKEKDKYRYGLIEYCEKCDNHTMHTLTNEQK